MNYRPMQRVDFIVVHCSATSPKQDIGVLDIRRWHVAQGWADVGYHYVIRRDGTLESGRPEDQPGAHAVGVNDRSIAVCMVGGVDATRKQTPTNNFTDDQFRTLGGLVRYLAARHPRAEVLGHRDLPNVAKACPSFDVRSWWQSAKTI